MKVEQMEIGHNIYWTIGNRDNHIKAGGRMDVDTIFKKVSKRVWLLYANGYTIYNLNAAEWSRFKDVFKEMFNITL